MLTTTFSDQSLPLVLCCMLPELEPHHTQENDLWKRPKYLGKCKDAMWSRSTREYLHGLRERHRLKHKGNSSYSSKGDVVIIRSDGKNLAQWKLGVVDDLTTGRDGVVRGAKLRFFTSQTFTTLVLPRAELWQHSGDDHIRPSGYRGCKATKRLRIEDIATDD